MATLVASSSVWSCLIVLAIFIALVKAKCTGIELLVDGKPFNDGTLYKPIGSSGIFVRCQQCGPGMKPSWFKSSIKISSCGDGDTPTICMNSKNNNNDSGLQFSFFQWSQVGIYTCSNYGNHQSDAKIAIDVLSPPTITIHPTDVSMAIDMSGILNCEGTGKGSITYQWETSDDVKGPWIQISNDKRLAVKSLEHSQQYRCIVSNEAGSVKSSVATVTALSSPNIRSVSNITSPPIITTHPTNQLITVGMNVTLNCEGDGEGSITYQWENSNVNREQWMNINNTNSTRLVIMNLKEPQQYRCVVSNEVGRTMSSIATVTILKIIQDVRNRLKSIGDDITMTCKSSVSSNVTISWTHHRKPITRPNTQTTVGRTGTLKFSNIKNSDIGRYFCTVKSGSLSSTSHVATLFIRDSPLINVYPRSHDVPKGNNSTFRCSVSGGSGNLTYSWERNSGDGWVTINNANKTSYTTNKALPIGQYMYRCIVSDRGGPLASRSATLNVYGPPVITIHPISQKTTVGIGLTLKCEATGRGSIRYRWELSSNGESWVEINNSNTKSLTVYQSGDYRCVAFNGAGRTTSNVADVTFIVGLLVVTHHPTSSNVPLNGSVTLTCRASGIGTLVYSWERSSGSSWTTVSNDNTTSYTTNTTLAIGQYMHRCRVSNETGSVVSNIATVNVYGPPTITTHPTNQLTTVSMNVTLNCEGTGRGSITYQWYNINGGHWMTINNSNDATLIVRNLEQSQQYGCVVSNEAGSTRSNVATVTILKITTQPVSNTTVIALQNITLHCSASVNDVKYSWHRVNDHLPSQSQGRHNDTFTIQRTTPHDEGKYYCIARKNGISVQSDDAVLRVDDQLAVTISNNSQIKIAKGKTVQLTAMASGLSTIENNFIYQWRRRDGDSLPKKVSGINESILTIPNAHESDNGLYYCIVTNEWNRSMESDNVNLIVYERSSPPKNLTITHINVNSFRLMWLTPTHPHGIINHYIIRYNQSEQKVNVADFNGTYTLDNLKPYTEYSVHVTAVKFIEATGEPLEGIRSTVTERTLAGEPIITALFHPTKNEFILNPVSNSTKTFTIDMPVVNTKNGPFSHLYIIVALSRHVITGVKNISTQELLEQSTNKFPLFYIAAVVNASQYMPHHRMRYILGAGDYTTDAEGHVFHNRELKIDFTYFFRVFSINSTSENEISTTSDTQKFLAQPQNSSSNDNSDKNNFSTLIIAVLAALILALIIYAIVVTVWLLKPHKRKQKQQFNKSNTDGNDKSSVALKEIDNYGTVKQPSDEDAMNPTYSSITNEHYSSITNEQYSSQHHYEAIPYHTTAKQ